MEFITINILDKEYQISCPPGFKDELIKAANFLNQKILEIRNKGNIISFEGMLITAAINLSHYVIQKEQQDTDYAKCLVENLTSMKEKLNHALNKNSNASIESEAISLKDSLYKS